MSTLYSHPKWPKIHPKVVRNELRDNIQCNWMWLLLTPSWLFRHMGIIREKKLKGQPVSFTDFFGYLVGEVILKKVSTYINTFCKEEEALLSYVRWYLAPI